MKKIFIIYVLILAITVTGCSKLSKMAPKCDNKEVMETIYNITKDELARQWKVNQNELNF